MPSYDHHESNTNTSNNSNNNGLIIHHKKSISRVLSKEVSQPNSSCRVYYGEAAGAVPFVWESQPGTPKHILFDSSPLPPLTPPPSFSSSASIASKSVKRSHTKLLLMTSIFARSAKRPDSSRRQLSFSFSVSSLSSHSSSSSSSRRSSSKAVRNVVPFDYFGAHEYYIDHDGDDDGGHDDHSPDSRSSPTSTLCFPAVKKTAWRFVSGCYSATVNVKNARLN